jgi:hypothetical protein
VLDNEFGRRGCGKISGGAMAMKEAEPGDRRRPGPID